MTALATLQYTSFDEMSLECPYSEAVVSHVKAMPGLIFDKQGGNLWRGPPEAMWPVIQRLEDADVIITELLNQRPKSLEVSLPRAKVLYDYQYEGAKYIVQSLADRGGALLADGMGLGKTIQALAAIAEGAEGAVLVLCPAVMVHKWADEAQKWFGLPSALLGEKLKKKEGGGRRVSWTGLGICSYDTFRSIHVQTDLARVVIMDEGHYLSNVKALRSKAVRAYLASCERAFGLAPRKVILTGTPMTARPKDLWNLLDILYPGRFGREFNFQKRYAAGHHELIPNTEKSVWVADGRSNLDELSKRLKEGGLMLRRVASEVLDLPKFVRSVIPVEMPAKARAALLRATHAMNEPASVGAVLSHIEEYKIKAAIELADDLIAQGKKPLLFTLRKETARILAEALKCPCVTGDVPAGDRAALLRTDEKGVATIYSVTTGIDLTHFDCGIFVGLDWVPSTLLQAEARLVRIGQEASVMFYYLIGMDTLDEAVKSTVIERLGSFAEVVGDSPDEKRAASDLKGGKTDEEILGSLYASIMARYKEEK